jgi:hypothetical protein
LASMSNFKFWARLKSILGSPVDLVSWQCSNGNLANVGLTIWWHGLDNKANCTWPRLLKWMWNLAIWQSGLGQTCNSAWQFCWANFGYRHG